jgi:replication factor A1
LAEKKAEQIYDDINDESEVTLDEVEESVRLMVQEYKVAESEVPNAVLSNLAEKHGLEKEDLVGAQDEDEEVPDAEEMTAKKINLGDIDEPEKWVTVEGLVEQLWDVKSDAVSQKGLLVDETGAVSFTSWAKSDLEEVEEGGYYRFETVRTDEDNKGRFGVQLNNETEIEKIDREPTTFSGVAVAFGNESGLVGEKEDQRVQLRLVLDDGENIHRVHLDSELTEQITGIDKEKAEEIASRNFEREDVVREMEDEVLGRHYKVTATFGGSSYMEAQEVERDTEVPDVEELLVRARSI